MSDSRLNHQDTSNHRETLLFKWPPEYVTCCLTVSTWLLFITRYILTLHIYRPIFMLLWWNIQLCQLSIMLLLLPSKSYNQQLKYRMKLRWEGSNLIGSQLELMAETVVLCWLWRTCNLKCAVVSYRLFKEETSQVIVVIFFISTAPLKQVPWNWIVYLCAA